MTRTFCTVRLLLALLVMSAVTRQASAITINRSFVPAGIMVNVPGVGPVTTTGEPAVSAGGGNLTDIFNAAADIWEATILDDHTVTISYGWADLDFLDTDTLGVELPLADTGAPLFRQTQALIGFDSSRDDLFLDSTPLQHFEYQTYTEMSADLGGGVVNTGRQLTNPIPIAVGADLFSTALHEIGHALGLSSFSPPWAVETLADEDIDVTAPRSFAGTVIPTTNFLGNTPPAPTNLNAHLDFPITLMNPSSFDGERTFPSAVDILAVAQIAQFTMFNLDPPVGAIPEPTTASLLLVGLGLALSSRPARFGSAVRKHNPFCRWYG